MSIVMRTDRRLCCGCFRAIILHLPIFVALSVLSIVIYSQGSVFWVFLESCLLRDDCVVGVSGLCVLTVLWVFQGYVY